jgi:hypothetical protein
MSSAESPDACWRIAPFVSAAMISSGVRYVCSMIFGGVRSAGWS